MTNGRRNRRAGCNFERNLADEFRQLGYVHVVTTRSESRSRDAEKIDLMNKDELVNGRFPFNVQAKTTTNHVKYAKLLAEMPTVVGVSNIVVHKQTQKVGTRFQPVGTYVVMMFADFKQLLNDRNARLADFVVGTA